MSEEQDTTIRWMQEIEDIPQKAKDPLAAEMMRRFNGAVGWQSAELVNGKPLRVVLERCWMQQNGVMDFVAQERAKELGTDVYVNLTALKADVANAYLNDALTSSGNATLPWIIQPTPRPDISPVAQDEIFIRIRNMIEERAFGDDAEALVEAIREAKMEMFEQESKKAQASADAMMTLMEDQCAEGGFNRALTEFLQYFPIYPFAVFSGPYVVKAPRLTWGRFKPRLQDEVFTTFRAISPFDFVYSPDSPDTQRGTCVFTRTLWTRRELVNAAKMPGYISENVLKVLDDADSNIDFNLSWLSRSPDDAGRTMSLWASNVRPVEVLTHYGFFSGRELEKYHFTGLDSTEYYNTQMSMVNGRIIEVRVFSNPRMSTRPIYTASFYKTGGDRIAGDSIAQRMRDVERAYVACLMYLMRNAANASAPLCEADYKRIQNYIGESELGQLVPGSMYLVDSEYGNGNTPAFRFTDIPSNMPAYSQLLEMFMQLADRVTNIPAALHGEAVGSGAMRTFRGMSMLQGNAVKALHAAVENISNGVFSPLGELMYNTNMLYAKDVDVKGDSQIITKGADGLLQKEMERQSAMEILQVVGSAASGLGQMVNLGPVVQWSLMKLLGSLGVPDNILSQVENSAQPMGMMPGGVAGGPNPAPPSPDGAGVAADVGGTPA